jgi:hypothetical protein
LKPLVAFIIQLDEATLVHTRPYKTRRTVFLVATVTRKHNAFSGLFGGLFGALFNELLGFLQLLGATFALR